jgi:hypothetical protein
MAVQTATYSSLASIDVVASLLHLSKTVLGKKTLLFQIKRAAKKEALIVTNQKMERHADSICSARCREEYVVMGCANCKWTI